MNRERRLEHCFAAEKGGKSDASLVVGFAPPGEVTEWPKVHDWKSCVPARVPRVRIPPSPLKHRRQPKVSCPPAGKRAIVGVRVRSDLAGAPGGNADDDRGA